MPCVDSPSSREERAWSYTRSSVINSLAGVWPETFVFLILSAALFTCLFEWDRYQIITVSRLHSASGPRQSAGVLAAGGKILGLVRACTAGMGGLDRVQTKVDCHPHSQCFLDCYLLLHGFGSRLGRS